MVSLAGGALVAGSVLLAAQERPARQGFSFRTAVDLINVTTTVTDEFGRFVPGLKASDFVVLEDGRRREIQQFDAERVPVSLGIAVDTSGSMLGEKMHAAQAALHRFLFDLLGEQDEVFLYRFDSRPMLLRSWTSDRAALSRELAGVKPNGGTAIYDTVAAAIPLAQSGHRRKKGLLVISDGNDTSSQTDLDQLSHLVRASEVLVYAIGIDAFGDPDYRPMGGRALPSPSPFPGAAAPPRSAPAPPRRPAASAGSVERVHPDALRRITDDSGGRTEIIVSARDLDPATAGIADELSRQYFIGYASSAPRDGRWHSIEVRLARPGAYTVRARRGFVAN
jgi:VWFA-related protein